MEQNKSWLLDIYMVGVMIFVLAVDQFTKWIVKENLFIGQSFPEEGFFRFTHTLNTGSAFGLFRGQTTFLLIASVAAIIILLLYFKNSDLPPLILRTCLGMQIGGALGNLLERITIGHVTDFIDVGPWYIFNIADSAIVISIFIIIWTYIKNPPTESTEGNDERTADQN